jgi:aminopeptidase N
VLYSSDAYANSFGAGFMSDLGPLDLLTLQDDSFALANAGKMKISDFLQVVSNLPSDVPLPVYFSLVDNLKALVGLHSDLSYTSSLKTAVQRILKKRLYAFLNPEHLKAILTAKDVEETQSLFESKTMSAAASVVEDPGFFKAIIEVVRGTSVIRADMKGVLYALAVRDGTSDDYEYILDIYRKSDFPEERNKALLALGATRSEELLLKTLTWALRSDEVRGQDAYYVFATAGGSKIGRQVAWQVIQSDFENICKKLPTNLASALVSSSLSGNTEVSFESFTLVVVDCF